MFAVGQKPKDNSQKPSWHDTVARYQTPDARQSWRQVANTLIPYLFLCTLMYLSLRVSYWLSLLLAVPAAGFMMRTFILFHDCGHGSFFKSKRANDTLGIITGILTFTPYYRWRHDHAVHHACAADLDRRGVGDVWMLTVDEYLALPDLKKLVYRVVRHPLVMFTVGSLVTFLIGHRFATSTSGKRERYSVYWTNLALLGVALLVSALIGFKAYVLIQLPILVLGTSFGVWLFYIQHQFEGVYWERHERWNFVDAAIRGSSYYKLPRILQWFTGNIGFHHIHHLAPRIPNYYLEKCHNDNPLFQQVKPLTLRTSLRSLYFRLWDEEQHKMAGFTHSGVNPIFS